jgi:hypothetical protein
MRVIRLVATLAVGVAAVYACDRQPTVPMEDGSPSQARGGNPAALAMIDAANKKLQARGLHISVEAINYFTLDNARPTDRVHAQDFRWVPNDPRRLAQGDDITYLIATNRSTTESGLTAAQTTNAIERAFATWGANASLDKVDLVKRAYSGRDDVTIYDELTADGKFDDFRGQAGNFLVADIVNAGWLPRAYFEAVGGPGGGRGILAFSVSFIFTNDDGTPTDINGDGRLDTALNEVYYNNTFGDPKAPDNRSERPWGIDIAPPGIDVETVALHENGHSLGLGHFGPPPDAVLNPVYAGIRQDPLAPDESGMQAVWSSWPNP